MKIVAATILIAANLALLTSGLKAVELPPPGGITKGYKSSFNGTWICHCPTYQQFDCYCAT